MFFFSNIGLSKKTQKLKALGETDTEEVRVIDEKGKSAWAHVLPIKLRTLPKAMQLTIMFLQEKVDAAFNCIWESSCSA